MEVRRVERDGGGTNAFVGTSLCRGVVGGEGEHGNPFAGTVAAKGLDEVFGTADQSLALFASDEEVCEERGDEKENEHCFHWVILGVEGGGRRGGGPFGGCRVVSCRVGNGRGCDVGGVGGEGIGVLKVCWYFIGVVWNVGAEADG